MDNIKIVFKFMRFKCFMVLVDFKDRYYFGFFVLEDNKFFKFEWEG